MIGGLIGAYFYRSGEGSDSEKMVMKNIKKERALAPDEVRDLRAANYEFTVDEYEKLCKVAIDTFPSRRVTKGDFELFLRIALQDIQPNFGDANANKLFKNTAEFSRHLPIFPTTTSRGPRQT